MIPLIKCTPLVALLLLFLHNVQGEDQPVATSHHSFHHFDVADIFQTERRSKRATVLAFTNSQAREIVNLHNQFRGAVRPEASNMEYMKWDNSLATMAMRYSQRCHWGNGRVVNVSPYSSLGQNLWIQGLSNRNQAPTPSKAVHAWHNEVRNYNFDLHECASPHQCGHYTQLVWAGTTSVGCGLAFCPRTSNWSHSDSWIMTCYYGPAGNYIGVQPYLTGPSCTQCMSEVGQCYNNMCRLCNDHNEPCDCRQQCLNCGTVDPYSCTCICQDGWYGPDCGKPCNETHPYCGANPGWPNPSYCGQHQMIPRHCPKMCGLCVDTDPYFICNSAVQPTSLYPAVPSQRPAAPAPPQGTVRPPVPTAPRIPRTNPPVWPPINPANPPVQPPIKPVYPRTYPPVQPSIKPVYPRTYPPVQPSIKPVYPRTYPPVQPPIKPVYPRTYPPVQPPINPAYPRTYPPVQPPINPAYPRTYPPVQPPINPAYPPMAPTYWPPRPTAPRFPAPGPTAVDCKIPCQNGGIQDLMTCRCTCTSKFTGQYCQHDFFQIQNGAMLRLVGDIRNWGMMELDMHAAIEQCVDMYCNSHVSQCCPGVQATAQTAHLNYLDLADVITGTGFPEVDAYQTDSYWILLAATEPAEPQLCSEVNTGGTAVQPALLTGKRAKRDASSSAESEEDGGAGASPIYVAQPIMLNAVDQNMAAIQNVLQMYNVKLAEVQRGAKLKGNGASAIHPSVAITVSLVMLIFNSLFV